MNGLSVCASDSETSGWQARLDLEFNHREDKTILSYHRQQGPLGVQRAFYPEGDVCHVYVLHPPGGIVGGDSLTMNTHVESHASALITTPGATKFYRSLKQTSYQKQIFHVREHATLEWLPQGNIFFPGAHAHTRTEINLASRASFVGFEIHCLGLPACNQTFSDGLLRLEFIISREGRPILIDRLQVDADSLNAPAGLRGNAVVGMLVATPADNMLLKAVRAVLSKDSKSIAATLIDDCLCIRYLDNSTEQCQKLFIKAWQVIRPLSLKREACPPRIWAT